ncbi:iron chaperone [Microbacterium sp. 179-B 1A2 NHS]|uniref:iron chaperone n=1 Tax=Microbacterium sp. 179-B 1A2 NHS TaxID=3142383 RepID=UPI0039A0BC44
MAEKTSTGAGFSDIEKAAMKQRAEELASMKGLKGAAKLAKENEACLDAISKLEGDDRAIAERVHVIVHEEAPHLMPKTFYGFPAYAKDGKVVIFFQPASKFKTRYGTVTFDEPAQLDDGPMWPVSFAVLEVTDAVEQRLRRLVRTAAPAD